MRKMILTWNIIISWGKIVILLMQAYQVERSNLQIVLFKKELADITKKLNCNLILNRLIVNNVN